MIKLLDLLREVADTAAMEVDVATLNKYQGMLNTKNYSAFVAALQKNVRDPKVRALLNYGLKDGDLNDDKISYSMKSIKVSTLSPTQNEIDIDKSLSWQLSGKGNPHGILQGGPVTIVGPIITANGKWIIDGHHRWSQIYCLNPNCTVSAIDIKGISHWADVLKATQMAIATDTGTVPSAQVKGSNLLKYGKGKVIQYVIKNIADGPMLALSNSDIFRKWFKGTEATANDVAEFIWTNVQVMQSKSKAPSGASTRGDMPQTDNAPGFIDRLKAGEINIADPIAKTK